jgi:hypothetical protein
VSNSPFDPHVKRVAVHRLIHAIDAAERVLGSTVVKNLMINAAERLEFQEELERVTSEEK